MDLCAVVKSGEEQYSGMRIGRFHVAHKPERGLTHMRIEDNDVGFELLYERNDVAYSTALSHDHEIIFSIENSGQSFADNRMIVHDNDCNSFHAGRNLINIRDTSKNLISEMARRAKVDSTKALSPLNSPCAKAEM